MKDKMDRWDEGTLIPERECYIDPHYREYPISNSEFKLHTKQTHAGRHQSEETCSREQLIGGEQG